MLQPLKKDGHQTYSVKNNYDYAANENERKKPSWIPVPELRIYSPPHGKN
jgi:hypothetical protein